MDDGVIALAEDFAPASEADWRALVDKTLAGAPFEKRLVSRTYDGIAIQPLYREGEPLGVAAPLRTDGQWDVRVAVDHPDPATANLHALEALEGGATSLMIRVDPTGEAGVAIRSADDLSRVLDGVFLDLAPVALDAGPHGLEAARWLLQIGEARTLRPRLQLHLAPLSAFAAEGVCEGGVDAQVTAAAALGASPMPETLFLASGTVAHEAGASEAVELGVMASAAIAYARALIDTGVDARRAFGLIALGLSVDGEYFTSIAKLRAARAIWARITQATGGAAFPARIEARSSRRMLSALDPWVNMLRLTSACFAAATGGADAVVLDEFSQPLGRPTAFARRQSRNTQLVLMEESRLGTVADPAAGSWYLETLSRQLAEAGWAAMQKIEAAGGLARALESGEVQAMIAETRAAREADLANRKAGLIGTSEFPDLAEAGVELDCVVPPTSPPGSSRGPIGEDSTCEPLAPWRASAPFEALRKRAAALTARPKAFLATLGGPSDYTARVGFARNLLAVGGIAAEVGEVSDYQAIGAPIAILCASDTLYAEGAALAARELRARGAGRVYLAGRPGDLEGELTAAGIDGFVFAGMDILPVLDGALDLIERA